ncbi:MAG TPA: GDSL family lipase [Opitutae bacterium]|nr:GDSL family lipase [Opitutae bacterium]
MKLQNGQRLLFIGDSITDTGRERPVGRRDGLGDGYVRLVNSLLGSFYPEVCINTLNTGVSGNRVTDLESRWQSDVLDLKPDWLSIMIGINDVWRQFDDNSSSDQVTLDYYEKTLRRLVAEAKPGLIGLVLMTPFYIESNLADPMRTRMDAYGAVVKQIAVDESAIFVDTQAAFDEYLTQRPTQSLSGDRVHPNQTGHTILAKAFLSAVEFNWNR